MKTAEISGIDVPYPPVGSPHVQISLAAGRLRLLPGAAEPWVTGSYQDLSGRLPCEVVRHGPAIEIRQLEQPRFLDLFHAVQEAITDPELDLKLGAARPYSLAVHARANIAEYDLGGLPITWLNLWHESGNVDLDFSAPNPHAMSSMQIETGAATVLLSNLANANCAEFVFKGSATSYRLDFGGILRQGATATITGGAVAVELQLRGGIAARITCPSTLVTTELGDGVILHDGDIWTLAALAGGAPLLTVKVAVEVGSLRVSGV